jgi:two-component system response regulator AtoC
MKPNHILVVDDEPHMRRILEIMLRQSQYFVYSAGNGREALSILQENPVDLVLTDMRMPEMDGLELLNQMREQGYACPVILVTAHGSVESAVEAMKSGASDYILRPFDIDTLERVISRVLGEVEASRENSFLREELNRDWQGFIGQSQVMQEVFQQIRQVAPSKAAVMITGETGTGKELVARAIHQASERSEKLFIPINCAAIPADMLEAELFGHEKGAFTGAIKERVGKFELANGGTLFLDELTEMPLGLQAKLLRVLQESTLERLGSNRSIALDIRLIAATNRDPKLAIAEKCLREDLYYRLNVFGISLPPLRARPEDISLLARHFIQKHQPGRSQHLPQNVLACLQGYNWPGNVRELENLIERALVLAGRDALSLQHFPHDFQQAPALLPTQAISTMEAPVTTAGPLNQAVEVLEAKMIESALLACDGNKPRAAAMLEISERSLWYKIKKYWPKSE